MGFVLAVSMIAFLNFAVLCEKITDYLRKLNINEKG